MRQLDRARDKPRMSLRIPGTSFAAVRDQRLRRERLQRLERDKARQQPVDLSGVKVTHCEPGIARGAYDAGRNLQAAAHVKAGAKRR